MNLTKQELNVLIEAVDSWESKHLPSMMLDAMLGGIFPKDDPLAAARFKAESEARRRKEDDEFRVRKERAILLKAKLIQMRDAADVHSLLEDSLSK